MIHKYTMNGEYIVIDTGSGAVHLVDKLIFDLLDFVTEDLPDNCPTRVLDQMKARSYSEEDIMDAYSELCMLKTQDQLFAEDYDDVYGKVDLGEAPIKAMCLHVSHDCNLRCKYCFANTGDFGLGNRINMEPETAKKAIDYLIERSGKRHNLEIDFFGGEPLLAYETIKETVEYCQSLESKFDKNFRFTVTTNGLLLNEEKSKYFNEVMDNVVLSLDGRKAINDEMRPTVKGTGSFDIIVPKMKDLVAKRDPNKDYYLRGTFTKKNLDFVEDIIEIHNLGFKNLSMEPVVLSHESGDNPYEITVDDLPVIFKEYEKLCEYILECRKNKKPINFFHFNIDLEQGPCVLKRIRGCGSGYEYVAITPEGDIYPCHQFVGKESFKLGNVYTKEFNKELSKEFSRINLTTRKKCQDCWAKYYCGGGCSAANHTVNKKIEDPYEVGCELERKRVECAVYLKASEYYE